MKLKLPDVGVLVSLAVLVAGVCMISVAAGLIVAGAAGVVICWMWSIQLAQAEASQDKKKGG